MGEKLFCARKGSRENSLYGIVRSRERRMSSLRGIRFQSDSKTRINRVRKWSVIDSRRRGFGKLRCVGSAKSNVYPVHLFRDMDKVLNPYTTDV